MRGWFNGLTSLPISGYKGEVVARLVRVADNLHGGCCSGANEGLLQEPGI